MCRRYTSLVQVPVTWANYYRELTAEDARRHAAHQQEGNLLLRELIKSYLGEDVEVVGVRATVGGRTLTAQESDGSWEPRLRAVVRCRRCGIDVYSAPIGSRRDLWRLESQNFFGHPHVCPTATPLLG